MPAGAPAHPVSAAQTPGARGTPAIFVNTRAILIGLALGLGLGIAASATGSPVLLRAAEAVEPLGQVFLRAIQMVVIPLVAAVVFVGVGRIGDLRKLGRLGGLAVGFFWATTLPAILIGMG